MVAYALNKTAVENVNKVTDRKIVTINHAIHLKKYDLEMLNANFVSTIVKIISII